MSSMIDFQRRLQALGYDPGLADGVGGPKTAGALAKYLLDVGLPMTVSASPTLLTAAGPMGSPATELPWIAEARRWMGKHEALDNAELRKFLKSDGKTLGDPSKLPWCGDFIETCIRLALPNEIFPGALKENPYWAQNWALLGQPVSLRYGAVLVFKRDGGGHVGFAVGETSTSLLVLGGNQRNTVSEALVSKAQLIRCRWPTTFPLGTKPLPRVNSVGVVISSGEMG